MLITLIALITLGNGRVDPDESDPNDAEDDDKDRDGLSARTEAQLGKFRLFVSWG